MKRIDKNGKRRKLDITYIYNKDGIKLEEILKEGYLCYLRNLKAKWFAFLKFYVIMASWGIGIA